MTNFTSTVKDDNEVDPVPVPMIESDGDNQDNMSPFSSFSSVPQHHQRQDSRDDYFISSSNNSNKKLDIDSMSWQHNRPSLRRADNTKINRANACWENSHDTTLKAILSPRKSLSPLRRNHETMDIAPSSAGGMKRQRLGHQQQTKQYSHRLRSMLQADLNLMSSSSSTSPRREGNKVKKNNNKSSLTDYQPDIDSLLTSLHSTQFVGQIDPKYHSQYLPTSYTMPSF